MPVVISMLNSYSVGGRGHRLLARQPDADHRRVARRFLRRDPVLHHVQSDEPLVLQRDSRRLWWRGRRAAADGQKKQVKSADDAAFLLANADTVITVPGYGLRSPARNTRSRSSRR
jgi:hypothetical protein